MARPSLPPAAEALFRAHQDRSTGWLTLLSHGREAKLYVQFGDLVGARLGFGHQTESQALLASGALVPPALDLLWARGQLGDLARVCEAAGVDSSLASEVRALASVRRVAVLAEEASFMPALVEVTFPRIRGARALRAAFEAALADPALLGDAAKERLQIRPMRGNELAGLIDAVIETPIALREQVKLAIQPTNPKALPGAQRE